MARKGQLSIQDTLETNEEFEEYIVNNFHKLICMEVYSEFCGYCLAMGQAVRKAKLEIGQDRISMAKALADNIDTLIRFKHKSEPVFLFISKGKLTRAMFGCNGIELCKIVEEELGLLTREETTGIERPREEISHMLPEEAKLGVFLNKSENVFKTQLIDFAYMRSAFFFFLHERVPSGRPSLPRLVDGICEAYLRVANSVKTKLEEDLRLEEEYRQAVEKVRTVTQAARKRRVCDRLSLHVKRLNFILFFPHCHQAHYDLYEKWDLINIQVAAKDTFILKEENIKEVLYMGDIDANEACVHSLLSGEVMVVVFKMFDTDNRDFIKIMRYALYEEIPIPKEDVPPEKQLPPIPAFERYASISKSKPEIRRDRYNAKLERLRQEQEERDRLAAEQARLAKIAVEERELEEKKRKEEERMARIQAGLPEEPEPEEVVEEEQTGEEGKEEQEVEIVPEVIEKEDEVVEQEPEEKVEDEEEFHSDVSLDGEDYIPPGGLFVPGLYSPPNELAKSNALAFFYPKLVEQLAPIESEFLPPHVLVMFYIEKRSDVADIMAQFPDEILNKGVFVGDDPFNMEHLAFSIKQYNGIERIRRNKDRLALMVSRKRSLPLLQLAGLNPCYISSDVAAGERDCLNLFPVGYGDDFEEELSIVEEEIPEPVYVAELEHAPEAATDEPVAGEEENEDEEGDEPPKE